MFFPRAILRSFNSECRRDGTLGDSRIWLLGWMDLIPETLTLTNVVIVCVNSRVHQQALWWRWEDLKKWASSQSYPKCTTNSFFLFWEFSKATSKHFKGFGIVLTSVRLQCSLLFFCRRFSDFLDCEGGQIHKYLWAVCIQKSCERRCVSTQIYLRNDFKLCVWRKVQFHLDVWNVDWVPGNHWLERIVEVPTKIQEILLNRQYHCFILLETILEAINGKYPVWFILHELWDWFANDIFWMQLLNLKAGEVKNYLEKFASMDPTHRLILFWHYLHECP